MEERTIKMRKKSTVVILVLTLFIGLLGNFAPNHVEAAADRFIDGTQEITIFHTNDVHANHGGGVGIATVAALKKKTENSLLVDGGDATQGLALGTLSKGEDVIRLMNLAGYDAMAAGNHEFDFGQEQLLKNRSIADFPILAANVRKDGKAFLQGDYNGKENNGEYTIVEKAGAKIGIFGLTTQSTRTASNPSGLVGITFEDEIETAKRMIDQLEAEKVDILICLAHLGDNSDAAENMASEVAEDLTGDYAGKLDAIIDGHSHTEENTVVNGVTISQTGTGLAKVGRMTFTYDKEKDKVLVQADLLDAEDCQNVEPDASVKDELQSIQSAQDIKMKERVADTNTTLWGGTINNVSEGRVTETNLGNLITDSMVEAGEDIIRNGNVAEQYRTLPIVAIENGGGIRSTIQKGTITKGDIINVLPFGNVISFKAVTPKILYEALENGVSGNSKQDAQTGLLTTTANGGFLQVGGMSFTYNPNLPKGEKITKIILKGETTSLSRTDESRQMILASNDFLIAGGNNYTMLQNLPTVAEGGALDAILENTIVKRTEQGTKALDVPTTEGRIIIQSDYQPKDYTAHIIVKDENGKLLPNQTVTYSVDGGKGIVGQTDNNALLPLTVSDGAHTISLSNGRNEAYICNYTGTGILTTYTGTYPAIQLNTVSSTPTPTAMPTPIPTSTIAPTQAPPTLTPAPDKEILRVTMVTGVGAPIICSVQRGGRVYPLIGGPCRRGYELLGWYQGTDKYDFGSPVQTDLTLTAKWKKVTVSKVKITKIKKKKKNITVSLQKRDVAGYQIKAGSNAKVSQNTKTLTSKGTKITIRKWKKKKCYIKVRAFKMDSTGRKVYGKWSKTKRAY